MFRMFSLQQWYALSGRETEVMVGDRLNFSPLRLYGI